jgi:ribonuclease-3
MIRFLLKKRKKTGPAATAKNAAPTTAKPAVITPRGAPTTAKPAVHAETVLGLRFRAPELLAQALTHSSFAYENSAKARDNERLEFLGDSVIGLISAEAFYEAYPQSNEGDLSKLKSSTTSTAALARCARMIGLDALLKLGRGEEKSGGRTKDTILAGVFESVVGAIYLDSGYAAARDFFLPLVLPSFQTLQKGVTFEINNYKSALQEFLQKEGLPAPQYKMLKTIGPDHRKEFVVEVLVNKTSLAKATGSSRKSAELKAAEKALKSFFGKKIRDLTPDTFIFKE